MRQIMIAAVLMFGLSATAASEPMKIGFVDMQKAIQATKAGKSAKKSLEKEFKAKKKQLDKKQSDIQKMAKDLEKRAMVLSDEIRVEKQRELQTSQLKFQKEVAESQLEIQKRERELTKPIIDKLLKTLDKVAKKNGYDMVLQKNDMVLLWAKNSHDLTAEVIKEFEK